jgi:hypothetical protein
MLPNDCLTNAHVGPSVVLAVVVYETLKQTFKRCDKVYLIRTLRRPCIVRVNCLAPVQIPTTTTDFGAQRPFEAILNSTFHFSLIVGRVVLIHFANIRPRPIHPEEPDHARGSLKMQQHAILAYLVVLCAIHSAASCGNPLKSQTYSIGEGVSTILLGQPGPSSRTRRAQCWTFPLSTLEPPDITLS